MRISRYRPWRNVQADGEMPVTDLLRKITKLEQESSLHFSITGRLFYLWTIPIFSPASPQVAKEKKITQSHCCYLLQFNGQNRTKLFFYWEFVWVMTHSHVHLSTPVIDDQSLSRNRHTARCGCHEILIQHSFNVLFFTRCSQLPIHSLSRLLFRKLKNSSPKCPSPGDWSE